MRWEREEKSPLFNRLTQLFGLASPQVCVSHYPLMQGTIDTPSGIGPCPLVCASPLQLRDCLWGSQQLTAHPGTICAFDQLILG